MCLVAILPWFTAPFAAIVVGVFTASSHTTSTTETHTKEGTTSPTDMHVTMEKERDPDVKV
jgi:hypothetical protein